MLIILGLLLLFLIVVIGGDRGVVSIISLCGNMLFLSLAIWLMAAGAPVLLVTVGAAVIISCITLFYQNGTNVKTKSAFIATFVYEISIHKPDMSIVEIIESGIQIGREVIGTTVNTLLFAYLGESLLLFSYLKMRNYTLETLLNSKILFQNCVSMIFGAIACVIVMPMAALLIGKQSRKA